MASPPDHTQIGALLETYLESLPVAERQLTAEKMEQGEQAREVLLSSGSRAVPTLVGRLSDPSFTVKDVCYDLVIEIGSEAIPVLKGLLPEVDAVTSVWLVSLLHHLGDRSEASRLHGLLGASDAYARHLSALAIVFQGLAEAGDAGALVSVLVEALRSSEKIEGTEFTVAGSSLACLIAITGEQFLPAGKELVFYNYSHFVFPPPVHPFPFASDYMARASEEERSEIVERVEAWWHRQSGTIRIRPLEIAWPSGMQGGGAAGEGVAYGW